MKTIKAIAVILAFFAVVACDDGGLTDSRDGKKYKIVKIGDQTWMAENLNYNAEASKCYNDSAAYCGKYGRLYNWETAMKACPNDWHLPSKAEWEALVATVGSKETAGKFLKATSGWNDYEGKAGNGEDKFGFSALPGPDDEVMQCDDDCDYHCFCVESNIGDVGNWWSSSKSLVVDYDAYELRISFSSDDAILNERGKGYFHSVRCIQNGSTNSTQQKNSFTDTRDNKEYKSVTIGEQVWMAENLNYEANGSKCYDNKPANCDKYGRLYNWNTAIKACPSGWHLPNNAEWDKLYRFADGSSGSESPYNSITAGKYLKAKNDWKEPSNGTNKHGFAALPGGYGDPYNTFRDIYVYSYWWSSNENNANNAYARYMFNLYEGAYWVENFSKKNLLLSIRCLQD